MWLSSQSQRLIGLSESLLYPSKRKICGLVRMIDDILEHWKIGLGAKESLTSIPHGLRPKSMGQ